MISVLATIEVAPGRRDEFLAAFKELVPKVLAEEGCVEYGPWIDVPTELRSQGDERADVVVVIEKWESLDAMERHLIAPHMLDYRKNVKPMVAATSLQVLGTA